MVYKNLRNFLILICLAVWLAFFSVDDKLHIIACDVGQGDAILIQKQNTQILIDGGPNQKVLDCLGKHMPFWDRTIELVISTHPEIDHYGGLIDVVKTYNIKTYAHNGTTSSNQSYKVLESEIGGRGIPTMPVSRGMIIRLGLIELDILHPSGKYEILNSKFETKKVNDNGIVILLKYAQFKALFMADVENVVSDQLSVNGKIQNINYLKVNHHGSKNGLSQKLLNVTMPEVAVISVGEKNSYGHPHQEILQMLRNANVKILRTDLPAQAGEMGDIDYEFKN